MHNMNALLFKVASERKGTYAQFTHVICHLSIHFYALDRLFLSRFESDFLDLDFLKPTIFKIPIPLIRKQWEKCDQERNKKILNCTERLPVKMDN